MSDSIVTAPAPLPAGFTEDTAQVNGVAIHYVRGGTGEPLVLLHGWPQTWYCWRGIMPQLAAHYTVLAVDLRGAGGSAKPTPAAGYDAGTKAEDLHQLVQHLGLGPIRLVGHDIGMMVAYAYAAAHPADVPRLVLLDALLPGIEPIWSKFLADPRSWLFSFHQTPQLPEMLTAGKEREYLSFAYTGFAHRKEAITPAAITEYTRAYSAPGAMSAGFEWYRAFATNAEQNHANAATKLTMPVLALGGDHGMGPFILPMVEAVAENVQGGSVPNCGHWLAEEAPDYLLEKLLAFLP